MKPIALWFFLGATALSCCAAAQSAAPGTEAAQVRRTLDIESQPVREALKQFGAQTGLQVFFRTETVSIQGITTQKITGEFSADEALTRMLANTGLRYEFVNDRTVAIRAARAGEGASSGVNVADQMRRTTLAEAERSGEEKRDTPRNTGDQVVVEGQRERPRPYVDGNADLPRTIDDVQPYYVFDAATIDRSGAVNIEDFLQQRLTMNTSAMMASQNPTSARGNISSINLRGLGADKTLILVNGRRVSGVISADAGKELQPDLNGIPLSAIDRIEVLPSSASGIYGGSAIGGVVNVVLKREYSGAELRFSHDNAFDNDSPRSAVSFSYGRGLENGRTSVFVSGQWSASEPMLVQDREEVFRRNLARLRSNSPQFLYQGGLFLGEQTNIQQADWWAGTTLLLDNGTVIPSINTHIPDGTAPGTPAAILYQGLARNGGQWNFDLPVSTQGPTGLLRPLGASPQLKSFSATTRRQMLPWLEAFIDFSYSGNHSDSVWNPFDSIRVPGAAAINPFNVDVNVRVIDRTEASTLTDSVTRALTGGLQIQAPRGWTLQLDYTISDNRFRNTSYTGVDATALRADLMSGALNPFVDTDSYPLDLAKYLRAFDFQSSSRLQDVTIRGAGPVIALPWGQVNLAAGLEHRQAHTPANHQDTIFPLTPASNYRSLRFAIDQTTDSVYVETLVPLVAAGRHALLQSLELQLAGRTERYTVDAGTSGAFHYLNPPNNSNIVYHGPTRDGQPFSTETQYDSRNYTVGIKYQPVATITARVSRATAFLPPIPSQLVADPTVQESTDYITSDPMNPGQGFMIVPVLTGGNPDLKPQNSISLNAGVVWEPAGAVLKDLRLNLEYYRIEQLDTVMQLRAQAIVDNEALYPGRVTRDGNGMVTLVDTSLLNLFRNETSGWDLGVEYRLSTRHGVLDFRAAGSKIVSLQTQYSSTSPSYEAVGFHPSEGGAAQYKANVGVNWSHEGWNAGWAARYIDSYKMIYVAGGPNSMQFAGGGPYLSTYVNAQGSDEVPSQLYHDVFVSYDFGSQANSRMLGGTSLQFGVRNVFNREPPLDAASGGSLYLSTYGDVRMRTYWLAARRSF